MNLSDIPRSTRSWQISCHGPRWSTGIVLNKDGSFQRTARFRGDLIPPFRGACCGAGRLNNALRPPRFRLGVFVEPRDISRTLTAEQLSGCRLGLGRCRTPSPIEEEAAHYESAYFSPSCICAGVGFGARRAFL